VTFQDFLDFLRSVAPTHVEIQSGKNDMLCAKDHTSDSEVYVKYSEGLDFSMQRVCGGEKGPVKKFSFKNEQELLSILSPKLLECLDGIRRI
jgi:hypothetical protein